MTKPFRFRLYFRGDKVYAIANDVLTSLKYGIVSECYQHNYTNPIKGEDIWIIMNNKYRLSAAGMTTRLGQWL